MEYENGDEIHNFQICRYYSLHVSEPHQSPPLFLNTIEIQIWIQVLEEKVGKIKSRSRSIHVQMRSRNLMATL